MITALELGWPAAATVLATAVVLLLLWRRRRRGPSGTVAVFVWRHVEPGPHRALLVSSGCLVTATPDEVAAIERRFGRLFEPVMVPGVALAGVRTRPFAQAQHDHLTDAGRVVFPEE